MISDKYLRNFQFDVDGLLARAKKLYEDFRLPLYDQTATKGKPALSIDKLEDLEPYRHGIVSIFSGPITKTTPSLSGNVFVLQALTEMTAEWSDLARSALVDPELTEQERVECYDRLKKQLPHITSGYLGYSKRSNSNVQFASMMSFDFDKPGFDPDDFIELCKKHLTISGFETLPAYIGPTGKGHRAIFVLRTPIFPHEEYGTVHTQYQQQFMTWYKIMRSWGARFEPDESMQAVAQAAFMWSGGKWLISSKDHGMNLIHPKQILFLGNEIDPQELVLLYPKIRESRAWKTGELGEDVTHFQPHAIEIPPFTPPPPPDPSIFDPDDSEADESSSESGGGVSVKRKKGTKRGEKTVNEIEPIKFDITDSVCQQIYDAFAQVKDFGALGKQGCDKARLAFFSSLGALFQYDERGAKLAGELGKLFRPNHSSPQRVYESAIDKYRRFAYSNSSLPDEEAETGRRKYGAPTFFYYAKELGVKLPFLFKKEETPVLYSTTSNLTRFDVEKYATEVAKDIFKIIEDKQRVLIQAATGTGKTSLLLNYGIDELINRQLHLDPDIIVFHIAPTRELVEEMYHDAQAYLRANNRDNLLNRLTYVNGNRKEEEVQKAYEEGARYFFITPDATKRLVKAKIFPTHVIADEVHDWVPQASYRKSALGSVLRLIEGVDEYHNKLAPKPKVIFLTGTPLPHLADVLKVDACVKIVRKVAPEVLFKAHMVSRKELSGYVYLTHLKDPRPTLVYADHKGVVFGLRAALAAQGYQTYVATSEESLKGERKKWSAAVSRGEPAILITTCISTMGFNTQATDMNVRVIAYCTSVAGIKVANIIQSAGRYRDAREVEVIIAGSDIVMQDQKTRLGIPFTFKKQQKNSQKMIESLNTVYPRRVPRQYEIVRDEYNEGVYYMKDAGGYVPLEGVSPSFNKMIAEQNDATKSLTADEIGLLNYGFDEFGKRAGVLEALRLAKEWVPDGTKLDIELETWDQDKLQLTDKAKAGADAANGATVVREKITREVVKTILRGRGALLAKLGCTFTAIRKKPKGLGPKDLRWEEAYIDPDEAYEYVLNETRDRLILEEQELKAKIDRVEERNLRKIEELGGLLEEVESENQRKDKRRHAIIVGALATLTDETMAKAEIKYTFDHKYEVFARLFRIISLQPESATFKDACAILDHITSLSISKLEDFERGLIFKQLQATGADEVEIQRYLSYDAAVFYVMCFKLYGLYKDGSEKLAPIVDKRERKPLFEFVRYLARALDLPFFGSETVTLLMNVVRAVGLVKSKQCDPDVNPTYDGKRGYWLAGVYNDASFGYDKVSYDKGFLIKTIRVYQAFADSAWEADLLDFFGGSAMPLIRELRRRRGLM